MIIYSSKYYTKYQQIIKHYKDLDLKKSGELYTESHHIIPKSMGGSNHKDNLVRVPARVHFLLHWMLYRIYKTQEMAFAWHYMSMASSTKHIRYTSKSFEYARLARNKSKIGKPGPNKGRKVSDEIKMKLSVANSGKLSWNKGRKMTDETKKKISIANSGKTSPNKGKTASTETKLKLSESHKGRIVTSESRWKMSLAQSGKFVTKETKLKMSMSSLGKPKSEEAKRKMSTAAKQRTIIEYTCPHCNKRGKGNSMLGYHFSNCKSLLVME